MQRFPVSPIHEADCVQAAGSRIGEVYHVAKNSAGGATLTPIAMYFVWRPQFIEGFHAHWRLDCFVRMHDLAPDPADLGKSLARALLEQGLCEEPLWVSWHRSTELNGTAFGEVFDLD